MWQRSRAFDEFEEFTLGCVELFFVRLNLSRCGRRAVFSYIPLSLSLSSFFLLCENNLSPSFSCPWPGTFPSFQMCTSTGTIPNSTHTSRRQFCLVTGREKVFCGIRYTRHLVLDSILCGFKATCGRPLTANSVQAFAVVSNAHCVSVLLLL